MRISDWSSDVCSSDLIRPDKVLDVGGIAAQVADEGLRFVVEGQLLPATCAGGFGSLPHPPFGHLLPGGEGSNGGPPRPLVDLRGGVKAVQRRCEGERDAAAVAAHDCFTVRPAVRLEI